MATPVTWRHQVAQVAQAPEVTQGGPRFLVQMED